MLWKATRVFHLVLIGGHVCSVIGRIGEGSLFVKAPFPCSDKERLHGVCGSPYTSADIAHELESNHFRRLVNFQIFDGKQDDMAPPILLKTETETCIDIAKRQHYGSYQRVGLVTTPHLTPEFRRWMIDASERKAAELGGFTTDRHKNYPTTDLPLEDIEEIHDEVKRNVKLDMYPIIAREAGVKIEDVWAKDLFIVKYDAAGGQSKLGKHKDGSTWTFSMLLNSPTEFEGGGTAFHFKDEFPTTVRPDNTQAMLHYGLIQHEGLQITAGVRYLLVGFMRIRKSCCKPWTTEQDPENHKDCLSSKRPKDKKKSKKSSTSSTEHSAEISTESSLGSSSESFAAEHFPTESSTSESFAAEHSSAESSSTETSTSESFAAEHFSAESSSAEHSSESSSESSSVESSSESSAEHSPLSYSFNDRIVDLDSIPPPALNFEGILDMHMYLDTEREHKCIDRTLRKELFPSYTRVGIYKSDIFTPDYRRYIIEATERKALEIGGYTTDRHGSYPTTDIPVSDITEIHADVVHAIHAEIYPHMSTQMGVQLEDIIMKDLFVVKYDADGGQANLAPHKDGSTFTFGVLLNDPSEFEGGGTMFYFDENDEKKGTLVKPDNTQIMVHSGRIQHEGMQITAGKRYLMVGFLQARDSCCKSWDTSNTYDKIDHKNCSRDKRKKSKRSSKKQPQQTQNNQTEVGINSVGNLFLPVELENAGVSVSSQ